MSARISIKLLLTSCMATMMLQAAAAQAYDFTAYFTDGKLTNAGDITTIVQSELASDLPSTHNGTKAVYTVSTGNGSISPGNFGNVTCLSAANNPNLLYNTCSSTNNHDSQSSMSIDEYDLYYCRTSTNQVEAGWAIVGTFQVSFTWLDNAAFTQSFIGNIPPSQFTTARYAPMVAGYVQSQIYNSIIVPALNHSIMPQNSISSLSPSTIYGVGIPKGCSTNAGSVPPITPPASPTPPPPTPTGPPAQTPPAPPSVPNPNTAQCNATLAGMNGDILDVNENNIEIASMFNDINILAAALNSNPPPSPAQAAADRANIVASQNQINVSRSNCYRDPVAYTTLLTQWNALNCSTVLGKTPPPLPTCS